MRKVFKALMLGVGVLVILATIFISFIFYWASGGFVDFSPIDFEKNSWKQAQTEMSWDSIRLKMVDDLVENYMSVGMAKGDLIELIGKPDETEYFSEYDMVYYLGRERNPIGIDSEWLVIKLKNGNVEDFQLARD